MRQLAPLCLCLLVVGCSHVPEQPIRRIAGSQSASAKLGIPVPSASESEQAIAAVKGYRSHGKQVPIGTWLAVGKKLGAIAGSTWKEVGWGAEPDGQSWKVTFVYFGNQGVQRKAVWNVSLGDPPKVVAIDANAGECETLAAGLDT